jgi:Uma2 family endonuclease
MTTSLSPAPRAVPEPTLPESLLYRLSVAQYEAMITAGILGDDEPCELIEGMLIQKMGKNPPHTVAGMLLMNALVAAVPHGFQLAIESPTATERSRPEPDGMVIRGTPRDYLSRRPQASDVPLVIEISHATLGFDQGTKKSVYAGAGFAVYWIVNLVDRRIEVYSEPTGPGEAPTYGKVSHYGPGDSVPLVLFGVTHAEIAVNDLLP